MFCWSESAKPVKQSGTTWQVQWQRNFTLRMSHVSKWNKHFGMQKAVVFRPAWTILGCHFQAKTRLHSTQVGSRLHMNWKLFSQMMGIVGGSETCHQHQKGCWKCRPTHPPQKEVSPYGGWVCFFTPHCTSKHACLHNKMWNVTRPHPNNKNNVIVKFVSSNVELTLKLLYREKNHTLTRKLVEKSSFLHFCFSCYFVASAYSYFLKKTSRTHVMVLTLYNLLKTGRCFHLLVYLLSILTLYNLLKTGRCFHLLVYLLSTIDKKSLPFFLKDTHPIHKTTHSIAHFSYSFYCWKDRGWWDHLLQPAGKGTGKPNVRESNEQSQTAPSYMT